jgi:hypothetical protein
MQHVGRQKHVALHRRIASADFCVLEQPWLCVGLLYSAAGDVEVFALALNADELQTHPAQATPVVPLPMKGSRIVPFAFTVVSVHSISRSGFSEGWPFSTLPTGWLMRFVLASRLVHAISQSAIVGTAFCLSQTSQHRVGGSP